MKKNVEHILMLIGINIVTICLVSYSLTHIPLKMVLHDFSDSIINTTQTYFMKTIDYSTIFLLISIGTFLTHVIGISYKKNIRKIKEKEWFNGFKNYRLKN